MNRWYHPAFETDLIEASRFLEDQKVGLGSEFLDAVEAAIETIMRSPHTWRIWRDGLRRFLIERFNFTIRYRIRNGEVEFLSILHTSRHPDTGLERKS
jgi:plasmid stabilization system protein ParE